MYTRVLKEFREKIRTRQYVMTLHAEEEMNDDGLTIFDVERVILAGEIIERQKEAATGEPKYLVRGRTYTEGDAVVVGRIGHTGRLVIITVYRA